MIRTPNLDLPIYDKPEEDVFDLQEWNGANTSIDGAYKEIIDFKTEIPKINANAELVEARMGEATLGVKISKVSSQLEQKAPISYVDAKVGSIGNTKTFKGNCLFSALPTANNVNGDYWYITDKITNYCWNGTSWIDIGNNVNIGDNTITGEKTNFLLVNSLLNKNTITVNKFLNETNSLVEGAYSVTDYIAIDSSKTYEVNYHRLTCFYDIDLQFVSAYDTGTSSSIKVQNLVIPSNAVYLRTNIAQSLYDKYYIADKSEKYFLDSNVKKHVKAEEVNFLRPFNMFSKGTLFVDKFLQNDGTLLDNASYKTTDFVEVKPNTNYELYTHRRTIFFDNSKNVISYFDSGTPTHNKIILKTPSNCKYIRTTIPNEEVDNYYIISNNNYEINDLVKFKQKIFSGKTYCSVGDSITWQDGNVYANTGKIARGYQTIVQEELGFSTIINEGRSGWSILNMCSEYLNGDGSYKNSINSADIISLFTCTNDFQLNTPLGTNPTSYDTSTFSGATNVFLRELVKNNIGKPILCIATPQRRGFRKDGETEYSTQQTNNLGVNIEEYVDRFIECCRYNGIPCLDLFHCGGFNKFNIELLTRDGLHPIDKGYEVIGYKIAEFIKNNR